MKTKYTLGQHVETLLSNPGLAYKLITYPIRLAFLSLRIKIIEARLSLRDWMKATRKK